MGFIEEMAKAKAYDGMKEKQITDTMNAAKVALEEQKAKEASMNNVFQKMVSGGLAGSMGGQAPQVAPAPVAPTPRDIPVPTASAQGLAGNLVR